MDMQNRQKSGQTMVEYVIIVVIVAIAAIAIFGIFGDTIRKKLGGAISEMDKENGDAAKTEVDKSGQDTLKDLGSSGQQ
jgi:Flp pilus assembly pilin Flp